MTILPDLQICPLWPDIVIQLGNTLLLSSCSGLKTTPVEQPEEPVSVLPANPGA